MWSGEGPALIRAALVSSTAPGAPLGSTDRWLLPQEGFEQTSPRARWPPGPPCRQGRGHTHTHTHTHTHPVSHDTQTPVQGSSLPGGSAGDQVRTKPGSKTAGTRKRQLSSHVRSLREESSGAQSPSPSKFRHWSSKSLPPLRLTHWKLLSQRAPGPTGGLPSRAA